MDSLDLDDRQCRQLPLELARVERCLEQSDPRQSLFTYVDKIT